MTRVEIRQAVEGFFAVLDGPGTPEDREAALRLALDRVALCVHFAEAPFDGAEHPNPPRTEYAALRARLGPLFPELGLYNEALDISEQVGDTTLGIGDALDDLVDIALDLQEVLLRWEVSEADALWHLRFKFTSHWGKHLRSLQLYLHERAY